MAIWNLEFGITAAQILSDALHGRWAGWQATRPSREISGSGLERVQPEPLSAQSAQAAQGVLRRRHRRHRRHG